MSTGNLFEAFLATAGRRGDAPFLVPGAGAPLRYDQLDARTSALAGAMAEMGVKPGDRVAVQVGKSMTNVLVYLAVMRMGAVHLPLNTAYTDAELSYFLGDAEPALAIVDPSRAEGVRALVTSVAE